MKLEFSPYRDKQQDAPLTNCYCCGAEIYRYDPVADIGGALAHVSCLGKCGEDVFVVGPAISFFIDALT